MATIASVDIALTTSSVGLRRGLDDASRRTRNFTRSAQGQYAVLNASIARLRNGFLAFTAVLGGTGILRSIDELSTLAEQSGINVQRFQQLAFAFDVNGISAVQFSNVIRQLNTRLVQTAQGTGEAREAFRVLGLNVDEILNLPIEERLFTIIRALEGISDEGVRAALAGRLFGEEAGPRLGRAINVGTNALRGLADGFRGTLSPQQIEQVRVFNDSLTRLSGTFRSLVSAVAPTLNVLSGVIGAVADLISSIPGLSALFTGALLTAITVFTVRGIRFLLNTLRNLDRTIRGNIIRSFRQNITALRGYGAAAGVASRRARELALRVTVLGRTFTLSGFAIRGAAIALRGFRLALAAIGGPLGLVIFAVTELIILFGDELANVARAGVNFFIRGLNRIISALDSALRFFGLNGIQFRFEEWRSAAAGTAMELENTADAVDEITESIELSEPMLTSFQQTLENALDVTSRISELGSRAFDSLADSLTDFVTTGRLQIREFASEVIREFIRIQLRAAIARSFGAFGFGPIPGRQFGGPVTAGQPYLVGETGPELFVPSQSGEIIANNQLTGNPQGNVTINISAIDTQSFQTALARDPAFITTLAERGNRQLGRR